MNGQSIDEACFNVSWFECFDVTTKVAMIVKVSFEVPMYVRRFDYGSSEGWESRARYRLRFKASNEFPMKV